jgi:hypothetical protein
MAGVMATAGCSRSSPDDVEQIKSALTSSPSDPRLFCLAQGILGYNVIIGTSNNDTLNGTAGKDCIVGLGGQDTIRGNGGDDIIFAGDGDDTIEGGGGNDDIFGGSGQDVLFGQAGNDNLFGEDGDDRMFGGDGNDTLSGGQGQDRLFGDAGDDSLNGDQGDDSLAGGDGNDRLEDFSNHNRFDGGPGKNVCFGEADPSSSNSSTFTNCAAISKPTTISTFGGTGCFLANEGTVTRDLTVDNFYLGIYNTQGSVQYNTGTNYNRWNTPGRELDPNPCGNGFRPQGDPWVTSSPTTGLFYASTLIRSCTSGQTELGIAGSTRALLSDGSATNDWQTPLKPITSGEPGVDGPSMEYDLGGNNLFATYRSAGVSVRSWGPCTGTDVGGPNCPVLGARIAGGTGASAPISTSLRGHSALAVNQASHDVFVAWREDPTGPLETSPSPVRFAALNPSLAQIGSTVTVSSTSRSSFNNFCPGGATGSSFDCVEGQHVCGCSGVLGSPGNNQCARVAPRVNLAILQAPTARTLYVAYDTDCTVIGGGPLPIPRRVFKSVMKAYDITNEASPQWLFTLRSDGTISRAPSADIAENASCDPNNDFSTAVITGGAANVGFFFYRQALGDPCATDYVGWVSPTVDFTTGVNFVNVSNGAFPYEEHGGSTLTDYTSAIRSPLPGSALFPVWTQPLVLAGTPAGGACNANPEPSGPVYSARVQGARVVP